MKTRVLSQETPWTIQAGIPFQYLSSIPQGFLIPGSDSQGESSSVHSVQEEGHGVPGELVEVTGHDTEDLLVCRL